MTKHCLAATIAALLCTSPIRAATVENPIAEALVEKARTTKLERDMRWRKLVHYRWTLTGGQESFVDGPAFFLADNGKHTPEAELLATIRGFYAPVVAGKEKDHPLCRFPARLEFLARELGIDAATLPVVVCADFDEYRARLRAKSVSVIFSSFYINNPSSAFGHLLLKVNSGEGGAQASDRQLLDYGINFAAVVDTGNALLYGVKGIFGMFPGTYTAVPYYYKVREYNDYESRDLWEYDLELTQAEVDRLVAHSWELGPTFMRYYYVDENCATHIISLLDAVVPERRLFESLPVGVILPTDGLRAVTKSSGLVRAIHYRPSIRTQFFKRVAKLDDHERGLVGRVLDDLKVPEGLAELPTESRARTLDAATDGLDFRFAKDFLVKNSGPKDFRQKLLVMRAQTGVVSDAISAEVSGVDRSRFEPHQGHETARLQTRLGVFRSGEPFFDVGYRVGLQDLLDPTRGYFDQATVEFGTATLRVLETNKKADFELREFMLMRVASLVEFNQFQKGASWRLQVGANRYLAPLCDHCLGGQIEGGAGVTLRLASSPNLLLYGFLESDIGFARFDRGDMALGVGPKAGLRVGLGQTLQWLTEGYYRWYFYPTLREAQFLQSKLRWGFATNWAIDIGVQTWNVDREAHVGLSTYF